MPKIDKVKKLKKATKSVAKPTKKLTKLPAKKPNSIDYYHCLLTSAQNNWFDPVLGKKQKITACCKNCKLQAPVLNESRNHEIKKLIISYQQVGDSLKKLLQPIK